MPTRKLIIREIEELGLEHSVAYTEADLLDGRFARRHVTIPADVKPALVKLPEPEEVVLAEVQVEPEVKEEKPVVAEVVATIAEEVKTPEAAPEPVKAAIKEPVKVAEKPPAKPVKPAVKKEEKKA